MGVSVRAELAARQAEEQRLSVWEELLLTPPPIPEFFVELASPNWSSARLMQRAFGHELLTCDRCGGQRKLISTLTHGPVVEKFLDCLGVAIVDCEPHPARAPPQQEAWGW